MTRFALDANCLLAAVSKHHSAKEPVRRELKRRLGASEAMVLPVHAVTEAFSVLTRLPALERLTPAETLAVLSANFLSRGLLVSLDASAYEPLLTRLAAADIGGGRTYDELIAETAARSGATVLLTLNPKHFPSPPPGLRIVDPTALPDPTANAHS